MTAARTRTVQNTLQLPGGAPWVGKTVSIKLNTPGFVEDGTVEKLSRAGATPTTDSTGMWSAELEVNEDIDPAGTFYTVAEATGLTWTFLVLASDPDPVQLRACLQVAPINPTPMVAPTAADLLAAMFANVVTA